jgi:hypothetical protein
MEQASEMPVLPRAHVLSYVATADSPTRVRQLAARGVLALAILHAMGAVFFLAVTAFDVVRIVKFYYGIPLAFRPPTSEMVSEALKQSVAGIAFTVSFITLAVVCFACVRPIRRARKAACWIAILAIVPPILACFMLAAGLIGGPIFMMFDGERNPLLLLLLIPGATAVLIILLLWDLCAFLSWIAKNPVTEKPPVPFIPPSGSKP